MLFSCPFETGLLLYLWYSLVDFLESFITDRSFLRRRLGFGVRGLNVNVPLNGGIFILIKFRLSILGSLIHSNGRPYVFPSSLFSTFSPKPDSGPGPRSREELPLPRRNWGQISVRFVDWF